MTEPVEREPLVTYEIAADCAAAVISMNRVATRNALSIELIEETLRAVRRAMSDDSVRSVILTGTGRAFASGADLDELLARDHHTETSPRSAQRRQLAGLLETMSKPTIAAINGHAMGGGLELALACTFRVASRDAKLGLPEVNVGILPGNGGTQRLARLVGVGKAMEMILLAEPVDAVTACQWGLVHQAVAPDELLDSARELAGRLAGKPKKSLAAAKESVLMAWDVPIDAGIAYENKWFAILCGSPDKAEGVKAFKEKRPPQFG